MKLVVDSALCQGYGNCADEAPDLLDLDDFGYSAVRGDGDVSDGARAVADAAVDACPVKALRFH